MKRPYGVVTIVVKKRNEEIENELIKAVDEMQRIKKAQESSLIT